MPEGSDHVATYGDSYCFCREVGDEETWQHFLARELGVRVSNYGVGNYGLDQAILRLERTLPQDPASCVVMAVTPQTIERILSVWKHYSEFGNVLAAKPRFRLEGGELGLIENPVRVKEDFLTLSSRARWLRANDHHYVYFRRRQARFPFLLSALRNGARTRAALWKIAVRLMGRRFGAAARGFAERRREAAAREFRDQRHAYHRALYPREADLFCALVRRFASRCRDAGAVPVLAMLPNHDQIRYMREEGSIYAPVLERACAEAGGLEVVDFFTEWGAVEDTAPLFVRPTATSHHSARGNRAVAEVLAPRLRAALARQELARTEVSAR